MTTPTPNAAPPSCHSCRYVEFITVKCEGRESPRDRCRHPSGPKPMHEGCGWKREVEKTTEAVDLI